MRNLAIKTAVVLIWTAIVSPAALAQEQSSPIPSGAPVKCSKNAFGPGWTCIINGQIFSFDHLPPSLQQPAATVSNLVPITTVVYGPDGPCIGTVWQEPASILRPEDVNIYDGGTRDPGTYPACPGLAGQASGSPAVWDLAFEEWKDIPLSSPRPYVAPGWAITGKLAYLETNGELHRVYTSATMYGELRIFASGVYYVDWGDGETTGPHSSEGRPWPTGQITHEYIWSGSYDIVVSERWTGTWTLAGYSGSLTEERTVGRIDDFPARQIQAVVAKPS